MGVKVDIRSDFQIVGEPDTLFTGEQIGTVLLSGYARMWDVSSDGQRFVVVQPLGENESNIVVMQNWNARWCP